MVAKIAACQSEIVLRASGINARRIHSSTAPFPMWLIDVSGATCQTLEHVISDEERTKADRFRRRALRSRYIMAHGGLRVLLRDRYGVPLKAQTLDVSAFGKAKLKHFPELHFSMSYSDSYALIGVCEQGEIGVDIEVCRVIGDADELMETHFTEMERASVRLNGSPLDPAFSTAFLKGWVRKEACVKAFGCGIGIALNKMQCGVDDGRATVWLGDSRCDTGIVPVAGTPIMAWACRG